MSEYINKKFFSYKRRNSPFKLILIVILVILVFIILTAGLFAYNVRKEYSEKIASAKDYVISGEESSEVLDCNGNVLKVLYFSKRRIYVSLDKISLDLRNAVVASEDERFYKHKGYDLKSLVRATIHNLFSKDFVEGGSTITQQLARNLFLTTEKTISRKLKEVIIATELEKKYTKSEILELYLNQAYFGEGCYGVETASRSFFGKSAADLDLSSATLLVAVLPAPSELSLFSNFESVKEKQKLVLDKMVRNEFIIEEEADSAFKKDAKILEKGSFSVNETVLKDGADYFIDYVKDEALTILSASDLYKGGLKIYTTYNPDFQKICFESFNQVINEAIQNGLLPKDKKDKLQVLQPQGAVVALSVKSGDIISLIGGRDYSNTKFNRALAERQPGSSFKIFQYTAAIDRGILSPDSILVSEPININGWSPKEWTGGYFGALTVRNAIKLSSNIAAVKAFQKVGADLVVEYAKKMGIKSELLKVPSLALGSNDVKPLDMAVAYATLSNEGKKVEPYAIRKIEKRQTKEILYEAKPKGEQVISPQAAYVMTDLLKGPLSSGGTAEAVNVQGLTIAGKTGTSDNFRDGWFIGYTPEVCIAIYIGSDSKEVDLSAIPNYGSTFSGQIFKRIMQSLKSKNLISNLDWKKPEGIIKCKICIATGKLANSTCTYRIEERIVGAETPICQINHLSKTSSKPEDKKPSESVKTQEQNQTNKETDKTITKEKESENKSTESKPQSDTIVTPKTSFDNPPFSDTGDFTISFGSSMLKVGSPVDINFFIYDQRGVSIELFIDGNLTAVLTEYPYKFYYSPANKGEVLFQAVLRDRDNNIIGNKIFKAYVFD